MNEACHIGLIGVLGRGEGKFVLLKLAFESTLKAQVCNVFLVPVKTGGLRKASLYSILPVNPPLLYQAAGAASREIEIPRLHLEISRYLDI